MSNDTVLLIVCCLLNAGAEPEHRDGASRARQPARHVAIVARGGQPGARAEPCAGHGVGGQLRQPPGGRYLSDACPGVPQEGMLWPGSRCWWIGQVRFPEDHHLDRVTLHRVCFCREGLQLGWLSIGPEVRAGTMARVQTVVMRCRSIQRAWETSTTLLFSRLVGDAVRLASVSSRLLTSGTKLPGVSVNPTPSCARS